MLHIGDYSSVSGNVKRAFFGAYNEGNFITQQIRVIFVSAFFRFDVDFTSKGEVGRDPSEIFSGYVIRLCKLLYIE
jgi:hypothetical protein